MTTIALQLYSVRNDLERDFKGTLEQVATVGFQAVELYNYGEYTAPNLKRLLDDCGLQVAATHVDDERLKRNLGAELDYALELGCTYLVTLDWTARNTQTWYDVADELEAIAQQVKSRGLTLAYHNEPYEIRDKVDGQTVMDVLLARAPSMVAELDIAWIHAGGLKPTDYVEKHRERTPLLHIKDLKALPDGKWQTVELGYGEVDVLGVLKTLGTATPEWLIIEQDDCERQPFESVKANLEWLQRHL
jgi:sugar phosphate isomerase/epimerase